jgi:peptide/nickel transport system substrate-binding protein
VEHGRDDVAFDGVPRRLLHEVRTQYANQAHAHPLWGVTYLYLNARRPPFNDVRVRRAVNYAADRAAAVPAAAQALGAEPTCQILPPNFPGFHRYCPYTMHPRGIGFWNQPDLNQARRLVAASGTKGAALTVWIPGNQNSEAPIAAALLRSIGYRPHIVHVDPFVWCCSPRGMANPRSKVQAGVSSWFADYPAASSFMDFFACSGFVHVCQRRIGAGIRRAPSVQPVDPEAAISTGRGSIMRWSTALSRSR